MNQSSTDRPGLLAWCRPGFEGEMAAELGERATAAGVAGYARAQRGDGYALFLLHEDDDGAAARALTWRQMIFARQLLRLRAELRGLDTTDRVTPVVETLSRIAPRSGWGDLLVEHPDSDSGRQLAGLARAFGNALRAALRKQGLLSPQPVSTRARLHVGLLAGDHLLLAQGDPAHCPDWPGGVPRLRMLRDAPSRSALKLEEALMVLLTTGERERWMQPGMRAADLGAAPGGWSWVLAREHLRVSAVDNGPMAESAMATGLIDHLRADGFTWQPPKPLDWMVCDMVEQPIRVAARMATWLREGWCRQAIFNLKLPMKKRWEETRRCLDLLENESGGPLELRAKQLYHDREEITVFARRS
ncbi:23S rRNA (cytidine(2498)-2'-O)-methyltransferase RlmM [Pseudomarimonas salicorniae]|uniref:Ribosomal RNA large subunit methyltransferase M n=1 Tax=Pseudomarimonas salicorniae TaxID=2933270 RepID=A0ABT0GC17_9GAMM|nr:23S rRNA (cytidine(2498)-2'-O)-methyltransferase RlmM [Lysobacter sp. CAU 1642]MCK7592089.1 23S rRNA (cytidine(2498)-2'-O)-methyltransferase RlmM [Lysobacter sp. CAU 1642]